MPSSPRIEEIDPLLGVAQEEAVATDLGFSLPAGESAQACGRLGGRPAGVLGRDDEVCASRGGGRAADEVHVDSRCGFDVQTEWIPVRRSSRTAEDSQRGEELAAGRPVGCARRWGGCVGYARRSVGRPVRCPVCAFVAGAVPAEEAGADTEDKNDCRDAEGNRQHDVPGSASPGTEGCRLPARDCCAELLLEAGEEVGHGCSSSQSGTETVEAARDALTDDALRALEVAGNVGVVTLLDDPREHGPSLHGWEIFDELDERALVECCDLVDTLGIRVVEFDRLHS